MENNRDRFQGKLLAGVAILSLAVFASPAHAETARFSIPPQPLDEALRDFGAQSGHTILANTKLTGSKKTQGIFASSDPEAALRTLLDGTGLSYERRGDIFAIVAAQTPRTAPRAAEAIAAETVSGSAVEGLVVTAQKRREAIQDVPIAISAFSADALQAQKIEGGFDLLKAIPNVTFSKNNFTSYNFSIRGIGTKAVSATTDPGVAVAFNNVGLLQNRLFEQEYFDIERVEVLRGPQGTLYGRNATAGVINVITQKPDLSEFSGSIKGEVGNFHTKRLTGFVNVPLIEDVLGVRFAGALTSREGYDFNEGTDHAVNGRDLWSGRLTIGFEPTDSVRAHFIWERFNEDDDRSRTGKQLCKHDPGPEEIGGQSTVIGKNPLLRSLFSQGCKPVNLYDDAAFGTPNGLSIPFIAGMLILGEGPGGLYPIGLSQPLAIPDGNGGLTFNPDARNLTLGNRVDPYGGMMQSRDLRVISSFRDPVYQAQADVLELNVDWDITPSLTFTSQTAYDKDRVYSFQDYNRFNTVPIFNDTSQMFSDDFSEYSLTNLAPKSAYADLAPGGVFCDPQLGCSKSIAGFDISQARSTQFSQEFRLQSSYDGPVNFSAGVNYTRFNVLVDYYVMFNLITAFASVPTFNFTPDVSKCPVYVVPGIGFFSPNEPIDTDSNLLAICPYVDPNPVESINGEGHNYFRSKNPYRLQSWAGFGETYWQISDKVKITAGLRYTDDRKTFTPVPSQVLLAPGFAAGKVNKGYPADPDIKQHWGEVTGRFGVDWKPDLSFTDETMIYAFYSHGYKGGGANPPTPGFATSADLEAQLGVPPGTLNGLTFAELTGVDYGPTFKPEFVDAYEVGAKNTLFGGAMTFNTGIFYYDYKDYQISQIKDRTAVNENFDAKIWGVEFETMFAPSEDLTIVANLGYLDTEVGDGESSIDLMDRTQSNPNYTLAKAWVQQPSNCVVPTPVAASLVASLGPYVYGFAGMCGGSAFGSVRPIDPATGEEYDPDNYPELNNGAGLRADLSGNELPNSPHWTVNVGAQYGWDLLDGNWRATVRGDVYWQAQSWARIYNADPYDKLHGWYNANLSFWIEKPEDDLRIEFYVKNLMDDTPITDAFLNSDDTALTTNVFTLDPRLIGLQVTKGF